MFTSFGCYSFAVANFRQIISVVMLTAVAVLPHAALAESKQQRPQFTPSDINLRASYQAQDSDAALFENADDLAQERQWSKAIPIWDKLLKRHPNCPALILRRSIDLRNSGMQRPALHAMEKLVKDVEAKGELYYSPYYYLAETYGQCGDRSKAEQTCLSILQKFPQLLEAATGVQKLNRRIRSTKVATEARNRVVSLTAHPPQYDTTLSTMKLPAQRPLAAGEAYEIVVSTDCFPLFRLIMTSDRVVGDTGVVKYIIGPPNYEQVVLLSDESQNYFKTSIASLMLDHCSRTIRDNRYGKVTKLGERNFLGRNCIDVKCQDLGESSYEKVTLAKDIVLAKPLVKTICLICSAPVSDFLPLNDLVVKDGYPVQRLTVNSIKKVKVTPNMMVLNPKYHQVRNKGELIYASNGALKDSDLDQFLQSK